MKRFSGDAFHNEVFGSIVPKYSIKNKIPAIQRLSYFEIGRSGTDSSLDGVRECYTGLHKYADSRVQKF